MIPIDRIRQKIRTRDYFLSSHAEDEMVDDFRYRIESATIDGRLIHVIARSRENGSLIIITVYALTETYDL